MAAPHDGHRSVSTCIAGSIQIDSMIEMNVILVHGNGGLLFRFSYWSPRSAGEILESAISSSDAVLVKGHADGGVHVDFFQRVDFTPSGDATGGDDREFCGGAEFAEVTKVGAGHRAFAIDVGAEECGAILLESRHNGAGMELQLCAPTLREDLPFGGIECNDDFFSPDFFAETGKESSVDR